MKNTIKILVVIAIFAGLFASCTKEERLPEVQRVTKSFDQIPSLEKVTDGADYHFNALKMATTKGAIKITCKDASSVSGAKLMVVYNKNFETPYLFQDISDLNTDVEITPALNAEKIDVLANVDSIKKGDVFTYFLAYKLGDVDVKTFNKDGTSDIGAGLQSIPGLNFSVEYKVQCPLRLDLMATTMKREAIRINDGKEASNGEIEVTLSGDTLICEHIIDENSSFFNVGTPPISVFKFRIDPVTFDLIAPDQIIWSGNAYGSYGPISFEKTIGSVNTCTNTIEFATDVVLPESGGFWYDRIKFTLKPSSKFMEKIIANTTDGGIGIEKRY